MNKLDELNSLHNEKNKIDEVLGTSISELKHSTPNFNFKFKYAKPTDFGIEIQLFNGANSVYLSTSDVEELYNFLKTLFEEPQEKVSKPTKKINKEDSKV